MTSVLQLRPEAQSHSRMSHQPASSVSNISDSGSEQTRSSLSSMSLGSSISDIDMLLAKRRFVGLRLIILILGKYWKFSIHDSVSVRVLHQPFYC